MQVFYFDFKLLISSSNYLFFANRFSTFISSKISLILAYSFIFLAFDAKLRVERVSEK